MKNKADFKTGVMMGVIVGWWANEWLGISLFDAMKICEENLK